MGPTNAIWVDAFSFLVAAAVQSTIRSSFRDRSAIAPAHSSVADQVRRALSFVRQQRTVLTLLLVGFGNSFAFGAILGLLVPYAVEQLDLADADGRIGVLYSAGGVGSLLAGVLLSRLFRIERVKWLTPGTLACSSLLIDGIGRLDLVRLGARADDGVLLVDRHHDRGGHHLPAADGAR